MSEITPDTIVQFLSEISFFSEVSKDSLKFLAKDVKEEVFVKGQTIFEKDDIFNRAKNLTPYFQKGLFSLQDLESVDNIRGYGMMGGIDMKLNIKFFNDINTAKKWVSIIN